MVGLGVPGIHGEVPVPFVCQDTRVLGQSPEFALTTASVDAKQCRSYKVGPLLGISWSYGAPRSKVTTPKP